MMGNLKGGYKEGPSVMPSGYSMGSPFLYD